LSIASFINAGMDRATSVLPVERVDPLMNDSTCHRLP